MESLRFPHSWALGFKRTRTVSMGDRLMKKHFIRTSYIAAVLLLTSGVVESALIERGPNLVYDDVLDITWLRNANLYETLEPTTGGTGVWGAVVTWADNLVYEGYDDWRLASASVSQSGFVSGVIDCTVATEFNCRDNELGYNFYHNLGGSFGNSVVGDVGPFTDIQSWYWSGTEFSAAEAWDFRYFNGDQDSLEKGNGNYAWAVRDGDVASIPLPNTAILLTIGLLWITFYVRRLRQSGKSPLYIDSRQKVT
jgi:hypothetical protein